jgi:hypothetical protein
MSPEFGLPDNVVSLDNKLRQRRVDSVMDGLQDFADKANDIGQAFAELMEVAPDKALAELPAWMDKMRSASTAEGVSRSYMESMVGPNQDDSSIIANIVAAHYEKLSTEQRAAVIVDQLNYLDSINCRYSRMHVKQINDPRLLRDLTINGPLYWPGLDDELDFFGTKPDVNTFNSFAESCPSIGLLGYTIVLNEVAIPLPIRHQFKKNSPELLDGVLDFAAARAYHIGAGRADENGTSMIDEIEGTIARQFDPEYHDAIRVKIAEADWVHVDRIHSPFSPSANLQLSYVDGELVLPSNHS